MFKNWEWDDTWGTVFVALVLTAAILIVVGVVSPHDVNYYYLDRSSGSAVTCVYAHKTWTTDETSFCSNDYNQVLEVLTKASAALPKK